MITYRNTRYKNGCGPDVVKRQISVERAFELLLAGEMSFGTSIIELSETHVMCRTSFMSDIDVVEFDGSESEMDLLVKATLAYVVINHDHHDDLISHVMREMPQATSGGYRPLMLVLLAPILLGQSVVPMVVLSAFGIEPTTELVARGIDVLMPAASMAITDGVGLADVLAVV